MWLSKRDSHNGYSGQVLLLQCVVLLRVAGSGGSGEGIRQDPIAGSRTNPPDRRNTVALELFPADAGGTTVSVALTLATVEFVCRRDKEKAPCPGFGTPQLYQPEARDSVPFDVFFRGPKRA